MYSRGRVGACEMHTSIMWIWLCAGMTIYQYICTYVYMYMHIFAFMIVANTFKNLASFSHGVQMCSWNALPFHLPNICTWESDIFTSFQSFAEFVALIWKMCVL